MILLNLLPLVRSQLVPPRLKFLLKRQRLQVLGGSILSHRVTTVIAPAGYGKSVWVSSLLEEQGWPLTAWLSLEHHDAGPSCFLYQLIHAVKIVLPDFGDESLRTITSLESAVRDWSIALTAFIEELSHEQELVLVLDDIHLINDSTVACTIIEHLVRWLPDNLHLVLIGRSEPPLGLYHQQLSGELLEIRSGQLLFTPEETRELMSSMELELSAEDIIALHSRTEGWAVGLRLAGILIKQSGGGLEKTMLALKQEGSSLYLYLGSELLGSMPGYLKEFLLDSSLLPYLEVELCNTALRRADSFVIIEQLHTFGLLSRVEGEPVTWRMHHLIGEYLADRATKLRPPKHISALRKRAGAYFKKNGDIDRAIEQAVLNTDWATAASLIRSYGYDYFTITARQDGLYMWIEQLPADLVSRDHWLLYFKGKSILQIDDNEAMALLSGAADLASQKGDLKCEIGCILAILSASVFATDFNKGKEIGRRFHANPMLLKDPGSRGAALTVVLAHAMYTDELQQGLKISRQALRLKLNPEVRATALYGSAMVHYRLGNLSYACQLVEETLALPFVKKNEQWAIIGYTILAPILNLIGDSTALEETCQKILHIGKKYKMLVHLGRAHRQLARMHYLNSSYIEARREAELAHNYIFEGGSMSFLYFAALELLPLRIKTGESARELLDEAIDLLSKLEKFPVGQGTEYYVLSLCGIVAMEAGELDLARQLFEKSAARWRQNGAKQNLAGTNLLLAHVNLLQGNEKAADSCLRKALSAAETGQWINFWEWHDETIYTMCRRALMKDIHASWAARILNRWFPGRSRHDLGSLLASSNERLRSFASSLFQSCSEECGADVFHIFYLGGFRVFFNGLEIPKSAWKTQKAENLFKYLAANRGAHPKEIIIEQFWPGSDYTSGDASLRMTLSHVRKAIGLKGNNRDIVILQRGKVYLSPRAEIYTDYDLFTAEAGKAVQYLEDNSPHAMVTLEQALQLYDGSFLPGDIYDDWTNNLRDNLRRIHLQVMVKLAQVYYSKNNLSSALQVCQRCLAHEPADEQMVRLAMKILWQTRQKRKALNLYRELEKTLAGDYDTAPEPETTNLYYEIRQL